MCIAGIAGSFVSCLAHVLAAVTVLDVTHLLQDIIDGNGVLLRCECFVGRQAGLSAAQSREFLDAASSTLPAWAVETGHPLVP